MQPTIQRDRRLVHLLRRLSFMLVATLLLAACLPVAPAAPGNAAPPPLPDPADDWARIAAAGTLVVGTAADYAPFEAYDAQFQIDGFDPALMRALGEELGVEVVFKDFAFDGLGGALALGQVDAAIAAITVTPQRADLVDFTRPYFASSEGLLVRADADIPAIRNAEALAGRRVGVERGSVYEALLQTALVEPGIVAAQDLILYASNEQALVDLAEARIDAVVTDLLAAETAAAAGTFQVASQGLFAQEYAIAVRKGSGELRTRLDEALAALQADGTLARLAAQYLGLDASQLAPLGEAAPAPPSQAQVDGCLDGAAFVADLTLPDQGMTAPPVMVPAQPFVKGWQVRNTGSCTWHEGYTLAFAYGNAPGASMGGQAVAVRGQVPPGATYDISADLVAPIVAGTYQGVWQFQNANGRGFGESLRVGIQVAGAPTPTPQPTQTPVPGVTFFADKSTVRQGEAVTLLWDVQEASEVYFYRSGQAFEDKAVAPRGEAADIPGATTTYELRVVRSDGQVEVRTLTVTVEPAPELPQIVHFATTPSGELVAGQCVTLDWQVEGDVTEVALFRNKEVIWEAAPLAGSHEDCPPGPGSYDYAVGARGSGGTNYAVATVTVVAGRGAAETVAAPGPVIDLFAVQPAEVEINGCVQLDWRVAGDVQNVRLLRDETVLLDGAPLTGSGSDCLTDAGTYLYRLEVVDTAGVTASREVPVTVVAPAEAPPPAALAPEAVNPALAGATLVAVSYRDAAGAQVPPLPGTQITAQFADGSLSGSGGCNQYSAGSQVAADGTFALAPIATTQMFCEEPLGVMDQEAQYLSALQTATQVAEADGQIQLLDGAGNPVAVFVRQ